MQIILSEKECNIIYEALMTEQREAMIDIANDKRRDRDTKHRTEHKEDVELLRDRFKAYVYLKDKK